ncbi:4-phosphoerythronate dehydrogenase [Aliidiomarina quisquiliarum]|uniref:4-phosphoerythronate dehydrogenase n=1 Tax=Aliidiomarina quisquiliarum TaxID=2938947 RepID=UPI00208EF8AE|nr:4-phosphoerythronate dehydrogenase [Aliidiomarina quisquiliarum]MCO4322039.1 4-phosphoerythronate dehydrogenase [Aliidiomarina quisquiliarum]
MNFLIHENLPKLDCYLQGRGQIKTFSGRTPPAADLLAAEVLLIRSVTKVTKELLDLAPQLKFVGTGTIGTEHVDVDALQKRGIGFASAPGANAISVGEYVLAAVLELAATAKLELAGKLALVVGAGHTGVQAGKRLAALGMDVRYIDPEPVLPKADKTFGDWSLLAQADVITFHVPLTTAAPHSTLHLMHAEQLALLKPDAILVNASRGPVVHNQALLQRLKDGPRLYCALDVWEGEPSVNLELLQRVGLATPHIAGHSLEGKIRGSYKLYEALYEFFSWKGKRLSESHFMPAVNLRQFTAPTLANQKLPQALVTDWVRSSYAIVADDNDFRVHGVTAEGFDRLRKVYQHRRELSATCVKVPETFLNQCQQLGFKVELTHD